MEYTKLSSIDFTIAMANSHPVEFDFESLQTTTTTNVPFSWETKPGVPKLQPQSSPSASLFERSMLKLPSPPYRSKSARISGDCSATIHCSPLRCRAESARMATDYSWLEAYSDESAAFCGCRCYKWDGSKERDPFVEACKKCTDGASTSSQPISGDCVTDGAGRPQIRRKVLFSLSRKCCAPSLL